MRVLIAAASFSSEMSGVQRHAFNLTKCLLERPEISAIHLTVAPWQRKLVRSTGLEFNERVKIHFGEMAASSLSRNVWYYHRLPQLAAAQQVDIVHLSYPVPVNRSAFNCPVVVTLHDLYPYEIPLNFGLRQIPFNRLILRQCLNNVDSIACVSQITMARLRKFLPSKCWQKSIQIANCVEPSPAVPIPPLIPGWQRHPFLLSVAQHRRNKNIPLLIRAFASLQRRRTIDGDMRVLIVGINGPETPAINRLISRYGLQHRVQLLEGLTESELQWCYKNCKMLVAPSKTEGFGLPVVEAMQTGCPIVCTDIPAFRELGGNYCRYVSLGGNMEERLASAIVSTLREPPQPPAEFPEFSPQILGGQYINLYRELVERHSIHPHPSTAGPQILKGRVG